MASVRFYDPRYATCQACRVLCGETDADMKRIDRESARQWREFVESTRIASPPPGPPTRVVQAADRSEMAKVASYSSAIAYCRNMWHNHPRYVNDVFLPEIDMATPVHLGKDCVRLFFCDDFMLFVEEL
jgi:hypothetical protein